jgi:hypothetical protein
MIERLNEAVSSWGLSWTVVVLGLGLFVATFFAGIALVGLLVVRLPADYFCDPPPRDIRHGRSAAQWARVVARNLLGVLLVLVGITLSLPGFPGPGLATVLIGITLVDFPGKRRLVRWLLSWPRVLDSVNRLRQRHGKAPLVVGRGESGQADR